MSKHRIRERKFKVVKCEACNRMVRPKSIMLVDPAIINVKRKPLYMCGKCRLRLVWNKVEVPSEQT